MPFTAVLENFNSNLWGYHISVPTDHAHEFEKGDRRVVCTLNGTMEFQCALMPKGDGQYFININKKIRDKLKLTLGASVQVALREDDSPYGLPMPEELAELLKLDPDGDALFHALTPGKQRTLLYIAGSPKRSETRIKRALVVVEHLKRQGGKIDFKQLNEDMKNFEF